MNRTLATLQRLRRDGQRCVAVTVASARGSTPRAAGARMLVTRDAVHDTIGGGHLELKAIAIARDLLDGPAPGRALQRFPLGASLGQCCGGAVTLLFDPLFDAQVDAHLDAQVDTQANATAAPLQPPGDWIDTLLRWQRQGAAAIVVTPVRGDARIRLLVTARETSGGLPHAATELAAIDVARRMLAGALRADDARLVTLPPQPGQQGRHDATLLFEPVVRPALKIVLFGAGHVGRALVAALAPIDCEITWVDARPGEFPGTVPPQVTVEATDDPESLIDAAAADTCFLVMTHSHALDQALAERILRRGDFRYFGLIGSATKRRSFEQRLQQRGIAAALLQRMTCPIGVRGIEHKEPAAIAIAVAAELLALPVGASTAVEAPLPASMQRRSA